MSDGEVIIMFTFHQSHCIDIKLFYINNIKAYHGEKFPQTVSYNRSVEFEYKVLIATVVFMQICCPGNFLSNLVSSLIHFNNCACDMSDAVIDVEIVCYQHPVIIKEFWP